MSESEWLSLGVCVVLGACHLVAAPLQRRLSNWGAHVASFAGGAAAAYVFLHLLPELEDTHESIGERIHAIVLGGFVFLFVIDTLIATSERGGEQGTARFLLRVGFTSLYNLLLAYTLSEQLPMTPLTATSYALALGLHLMMVDLRLVEEFGGKHHKWGRFVLIASLLAGWTLSRLTQWPHVTLDILTAMMAGFIIFTVFGEELPKRGRIRVRWFVVGAGFFFLLEVLSKA